jgi:hypothetical protein
MAGTDLLTTDSAAEFEVTTEECSENLLSFLKELVHNKLIEVGVETNK